MPYLKEKVKKVKDGISNHYFMDRTTVEHSYWFRKRGFVKPKRVNSLFINIFSIVFIAYFLENFETCKHLICPPLPRLPSWHERWGIFTLIREVITQNTTYIG